MRCKIQAFHQDGNTVKSIAANLKISRNTVRKWVMKIDGDKWL